VPHICDAIQDWIQQVGSTPTDGKEGAPDVCVIELGGTVGDIESMPFIEVRRQEWICMTHKLSAKFCIIAQYRLFDSFSSALDVTTFA
jgi:CTP synthase (UTP-ammonia lyase)